MYLLAGLAVTAVVIAAVGMIADLGAVGEVLAHLHPGPVVAAVALGVAAHGLRFVRWHLLLGVAGDRRLATKPSALAFLAGSLFAFTPARAGEVAKAVYARRLGGATVAGPLAAIAAERIGDVAVMVLLGTAGLLAVGALSAQWPALAVGACLVVGAAVAALVVKRSTRSAGPGDVSVGSPGWRWLAGVLRPAGRLFSLEGVTLTLGLGVVIWLLEVAVFWLSLVAVGSGGLAVALAVFPLGSLGGAISLLPAGLGVTEGGIAGLVAGVSGTSFEQGLAAALVTRAVISGTVTVLGLGALVAVRGQRLARQTASSAGPTGAAGPTSAGGPAGARSPRAVRLRRAMYAVVAVAIALATWLGVSALLTLRESRRISASAERLTLASFVAGPDEAGAAIDDLRASVGRLRWYSLPFRLTTAAWSPLPGRFGAVAEINDLLAYMDALLDGTRPVVTVLTDAASAAGDLPTASGLVAAFDGLRANRLELAAATRSLERAGSLRARIDESSLPEGLRAGLVRAETLRVAALDGVRLWEELEPPLARLLPLLNAFAGPSGGGSTAPPGRFDTHTVLADARSILEALDRSSAIRDHALQAVIVDAGSALDSLANLEVITRAGLPRDRDAARRLEQSLAELDRRLAEFADSVSGIAGSAPLAGFASSLRGQVDRARDGIAVVSELLAFDTRRTHIVLGQDDEEVRPTGGFIGTVWELTFDRGVLIDHRVFSSYVVDEHVPVERWMRAPESFRTSFGSEVMPFRDANWWPDFRVSAAHLRDIYGNAQGVRPHAVIGITQAALAELVGALGGVQVAAGTTSLTLRGGDVRQFVREGVKDSGATSGEDPRRQAARLLGEAIITRLASGSDVDPLHATAALWNSAKAATLTVDTGASRASKALAALGWNGAIGELRPGESRWYEANVYSPKFTEEIHRTFEYARHESEDGTIETRLSVTVSNLLPTVPVPCAQPALPPNPPCYWFRWWVAIDGDADLVSMPSGRQLPGSLAASRSSGSDPLSCCVVESDGANTIISGVEVVPPGESAQIDLSFRHGG
jgi:uncharacterized membrane protein YbhN (UPF0104 family)